MESSDDLDATLKDRGTEYGDFKDQAMIAQLLKNVVRTQYAWVNLGPYHREAIEMILHKIARIVNGNPNNADSWLDIEGYARITRLRLPNE